jgi:hypothetical protein
MKFISIYWFILSRCTLILTMPLNLENKSVLVISLEFINEENKCYLLFCYVLLC